MQNQFKVCTTCGQDKPFSEFWQKSETKKDGTRSYRPSCKECEIKKKLQKYHQGGGKEEQKKRSFRALPHGRLFVDHCHNTGKYRGLLCVTCNTGLGAFKDNVDLMQKAIEYLNETSLRHRNQSGT